MLFLTTHRYHEMVQGNKHCTLSSCFLSARVFVLFFCIFCFLLWCCKYSTNPKMSSWLPTQEKNLKLPMIWHKTWSYRLFIPNKTQHWPCVFSWVCYFFLSVLFVDFVVLFCLLVAFFVVLCSSPWYCYYWQMHIVLWSDTDWLEGVGEKMEHLLRKKKESPSHCNWTKHFFQHGIHHRERLKTRVLDYLWRRRKKRNKRWRPNSPIQQTTSDQLRIVTLSGWTERRKGCYSEVANAFPAVYGGRDCSKITSSLPKQKKKTSLFWFRVIFFSTDASFVLCLWVIVW